jgi:O-antigen/teichoic acid export membrane protein
MIAEGILFIPLSFITLRSIKLFLNVDHLKSSLSFGLPIVPHQLSGWALNMSDRILLNRFVSLDQVGIYDLGYKFGLVMDIILQSFNLSWSPYFFRIASTEKNAREVIGRLVTYYTFGVYVLGLVTSLLANDIIKIISIPAFSSSGGVVTVVVIGFIMHGFYFMSVNQLFYAKKTKFLPVYSGISAGINIVMNLFTIPRFGYMAAAWNTVVGYTILFILVFRESNKVFPIPIEYRRIGILTLVTVITFLLASSVHLNNSYLNILTRLAIISIYPAGLFLFRFFTIRELSFIKTLFRQKAL